MRILCIADVESKALWDHFSSNRPEDISLIISCGDLDSDYLQFLVTMLNCPLLYVHGNHDENYDRKPPLGCVAIDDRIEVFRGLRILGLGGSMRYRDGDHMYTEKEMQKRISRLSGQLFLKNGIDILVTHAPAKGYGDLPDLPHQGFECFGTLIEKYRPRWMLHGHVHESYGRFTRERQHPSGCTIINVCESYILEVPDELLDDSLCSGSVLRDLYLRLKGAR